MKKDGSFFAGGEFVFSPKLLFQRGKGQFSAYASRLTHYHRSYTFGAYYSIVAILRDMALGSSDRVLLPSYLCPSIIEPFRKARIKYDFYKMREGLNPDLDDIDKKSGNGLKAILFIDYFGRPYIDYLADAVSALRNQGVLILQDTVQAWLDNENDLYGDYCFNSTRKYSPFEASVLLSKTPMRVLGTKKMPASYYWNKRSGQFLRYFYTKHGVGKPSTFLRRFEKSNQLYHQSGILKMPNRNRHLLDKIDFENMGKQRREVYRFLIENLGLNLVLEPSQKDFTPLGIAIKVRNRDQKRRELIKRNIFCPIHWLLDEEIDKKEHPYCWDLQEHELSIPINIDPIRKDFYAGILEEVLA